MREIKFRAWNLLNDEMKKVRLIHFGKNIITDEEQPCDIDLAKVVLMQYTGLKDKNGVEIYEEDIIKEGNHIKKVIFGEYEADDSYYVCGGAFVTDSLCNNNINDGIVEVIGNIYENPELLEDNK